MAVLALIGGATAALSTTLTYRLRRRATQRWGLSNQGSGLLEDALVLSAAARERGEEEDAMTLALARRDLARAPVGIFEHRVDLSGVVLQHAARAGGAVLPDAGVRGER